VAAPSPFGDAEHAWTAWAKRGLAVGSYELREQLLDRLLVAGRIDPRIVPDPRAFPSFDVTEHGFSMLEQWAKAGHPTAAGRRTEENATTRYLDRMVCASAESERGASIHRASNCHPTFYAAVLANPRTRSRLFELVRRSRDPILRREVSVNLIELTTSSWGGQQLGSVQAVLDLWQLLGADSALFTEMTRLLAGEVDRSTELRVALYDQSVQYFRARPRERGVLLFLLARIDGHGRTEVNWEHFEQIYSASIEAEHLTVYLEQGPLAFEELRELWPALGKGWSVSDVIARSLPRYLEAPMAERYDGTRASVLRGIGSSSARYDTVAGLLKVRGVLQAFVQNDPRRERVFRDALKSMDYEIERLQARSPR
jgi:hypothetical protein